MRTILILAWSALSQTVRSRAVVGYGFVLVGIVLAFSLFGGDSAKVTLTIVSLLLLVVPLVTLIIVALQHYNNREFIELLLAQPISRRAFYWGQWIGMTAGLLTIALLPILLGYLFWQSLDVTVVAGSTIVLTLCFSALAYRIAVGQSDKARGIGIALVVWLYCAILYDAILIAMMALLEKYPLEKVLLLLLALNPIDAIRIAVLLHSDTSALLGITGAFLREFFGSNHSMLLIAVVVALWIGYPLIRGERVFCRRDF